MATRPRSTPVDSPRVPRARKAQGSATGRHVIDLTQLPSSEIRMADYEKAFGLPSALHQQPLPLLVTRRGVGRLRSFVSRRKRA
ncbi:MAG: hypothetical protein M3P04_05220 [Actinomycetota bacterium]|nr:hypothetical protein [Actinomycetota bacterium]